MDCMGGMEKWRSVTIKDFLRGVENDEKLVESYEVTKRRIRNIETSQMNPSEVESLLIQLKILTSLGVNTLPECE